ncbi:MAG TPA: hypothetical protein VJU83_07000 [Burkholderiales bacterium]|nr:hypothetical protein [Burkholderiales bacterium]
MYTVHIAEDRCYAWVMMAFAAFLFLAVFPIFLMIGLLSALVVLIYRGSDFVTWRSPKDCVSPLSWAVYEWDYQGLGGKQTGLRALGVEVAFNGLLRS